MAQAWKGSDIRQKYRDITGLKSTSQRSDDLCLDDINDYYQNHFPIESELNRFESDYSQITAVNDDGNYEISADYLLLKPPYTIDNFPVRQYGDKTSFDQAFPLETYPMNLTDPSLAEGTVSAAAVKNIAFSYKIGTHSYSKVASETALSGETLPQDKYGAWRLEIDGDGTISVIDANNAEGYNSAAKAVRALVVESGDNNCMGFITVISTSGTFIPGTTLLSGVTATYTDGYHSTRATPYGILIDRNRLWVGPKPDDIHIFKGTGILRPDVLTADTAPIDKAWGIVIAYGAAVIRKSEEDDKEAGPGLLEAKNYWLALIKRPQLQGMAQTRSKPRW